MINRSYLEQARQRKRERGRRRCRVSRRQISPSVRRNVHVNDAVRAWCKTEKAQDERDHWQLSRSEKTVMRRSRRRHIRRVTIALLVIVVAHRMEKRDIRQGQRDRVRLRNLKNGRIHARTRA